jgi:hypothetical protein
VTTDVTVEGLIAMVADAVVDRLAAVLGETVLAEPWRLLSAREAGELLGCSERWIYAASQVGSDTYLGLPYVQVGDRKRFDPQALKSWCERRQIPSEPPAGSSQDSPTPLSIPSRGRRRIPNPRPNGGSRR